MRIYNCGNLPSKTVLSGGQKSSLHLVESFSNMMLLACLFSLRLLQAAAGEPDVLYGMACDPKNVECDQPSLGRQVTREFSFSLVKYTEILVNVIFKSS